MSGTQQLVARLLYGTGGACAGGFACGSKTSTSKAGEIVVRSGKGDKDRTTTFPRVLARTLRVQMEESRALNDRDREEGFRRVWMPDALAVKYPNANAIRGVVLCCKSCGAYNDT